jgi:hypothetical protein
MLFPNLFFKQIFLIVSPRNLTECEKHSAHVPSLWVSELIKVQEDEDEANVANGGKPKHKTPTV